MALSADGMLRSPTFFVGAENQRKTLDAFKKEEQQLAETPRKAKPLCFNASSYQKTHPVKAEQMKLKGQRDADVCLTAPLVLGVADGVSQIEDFGIDASELPKELLTEVEALGMHQLIPDTKLPTEDAYHGPVALLRRAFEATKSLGSLTVVLALMDNNTKIHGKLHPMVAIVNVGDCELLILRRRGGVMSPLEVVTHTEMQRIEGNVQSPLQLARVDDRIDPNFHDGLTIEVIEKGSAVHCVSTYEGDIIIMGSDGVFDNLFTDEISEIVNSVLKPGQQGPIPKEQLTQLAQLIVTACHKKTLPGTNRRMQEAPIGLGGKKDDTSCVIAEVVAWTPALQKTYQPAVESNGGLLDVLSCCCSTDSFESESDDDVDLQSASPSKSDRQARRMSKSASSTEQQVESQERQQWLQWQQQQQSMQQQMQQQRQQIQQMQQQMQQQQQQMQHQRIQQQMQQQQQMRMQIQMQKKQQFPSLQQGQYQQQTQYGQQCGQYPAAMGGCSGYGGAAAGFGSFRVRVT